MIWTYTSFGYPVKAVSEGYTEMVSVAIAADLDEEFVGPCGMCR